MAVILRNAIENDFLTHQGEKKQRKDEKFYLNLKKQSQFAGW
jgi:hypothetical protein